MTKGDLFFSRQFARGLIEFIYILHTVPALDVHIGERQSCCSPASDLLGRCCVCPASGLRPAGGTCEVTWPTGPSWEEVPDDSLRRRRARPAFPVPPRVATGPRGVHVPLGKGLGIDSLCRRPRLREDGTTSFHSIFGAMTTPLPPFPCDLRPLRGGKATSNIAALRATLSIQGPFVTTAMRRHGNLTRHQVACGKTGFTVCHVAIVPHPVHSHAQRGPAVRLRLLRAQLCLLPPTTGMIALSPKESSVQNQPNGSAIKGTHAHPTEYSKGPRTGLPSEEEQNTLYINLEK